MIVPLKNRWYPALAFLLAAAFTASAVEEYCLYWKMDSRISGKNNEVVKVNSNDKPLPREPEQLAATGVPDYLIVNKTRQPRASTRTAFLMTNRCLKNDNYAYTGTNSPIWVGAYLRQNPYVYEDLVYANISSLNGKTIDSVFFKYNVGTNSTGGSTVGFLYEQDKGTYSASAVFNTYALSAWTSNVADDTILQTVTGWVQMSSRAAFKTLVQAWTDQSKTNNGLIFAGNPAYYGYYWVISACTLVVWNSSGNSAPTDIALSASSVAENANTGTTVGALTTTDPDVGQTHTYSLVSGTGDDDNAKFQISGSNLQTNYVFNYEMGTSYSVRIRTTDNGTPALTYDEAFAITISNVNDAPVAGSGKALDFDAADDVVDCGSGSVVDDMSALTIEAWIYPKSAGENSLGRILDKAASTTPTSGWCFRVGTNNYLSFVVDYNSTDLQRSSSNSTITLNAWNHVAVTWDGTATATNAHIYVNGTETSYQTTTNGSSSRVSDASSNLRIGNSSDGTRAFDGYIDEVRIWNAVRTATQIQDSMYTHINPASTNLVGYYPMDATKGTAVRDFTSNANTGECANMTDADWIASTAWQSRSVNDIDVLFHTPGYDEDASATLTLSQVTGPTKGKLRYTNNSSHYLLFYTPTMNQSGSDSYVFRVSDGTATADYTITPSITNASNGPYAGSGKAMNFDTASSKHVDLPSNCMISTGSAFTLEFWVKPNGPNNLQRLFIQGASDCSNEMLMAYWYSGHIEFLRATSGTSGTANKASGAITNAVWTHVAWTYDGASTDNVYVNGVSSTGTVGGGSQGYDGNNYIGRRTAGNYFNGQLDEIRLWDYERTSGETSGEMYSALNGSEDGLVAYWRMDRASGNQLRDWSANGYSGRLHNMVDADWVASTAWKDRTTQNDVALTHSGGFDPDADAVTLSQVTAPSQGSLSFNNTNRTVTFTPQAGSTGTFTYTYRIADALHRATSDYDMSVVVTSSDPYVVTYNPADDATGVALGANLVLTFNEAVDAETGNIVIKKTSDNSIFETIGVTSGNVTGSGTTTITINPTNNFAGGTGYYVLIDATAFDDANSNSYAGIPSSTTTWNFTAGTNPHAPIAGSGNALKFDSASTNYVSLGTGGMITGNVWTLEFWVKPNNPNASQRLFIQGTGGYASRQLAAVWEGSKVQFCASTTTPIAPTIATTALTDAVWTHVAWGYNNGSNTVYVDGASSSSAGNGISYGMDGENFIACRHSTTYKNLFNGQFDEIRLWNDIRTQQEVQDNMYAPLTGSESNLVCYWRMDTTAGTTLKNYASGGGYNGTLTNMSNSNWVASEAWKNRSTNSATPLTHSAGWEPDGDAVTLSQVTAPSNGSLSFNNTDKTVTFTPQPSLGGTFTYSFLMDDGSWKDTFDMSVAVTQIAQDDYSNWTYSKDLFINTTSTGADVSGNVVNFPLLVRLNDNNFTFSQALSTGYDIRFSKSGGTHLPYERERWDNTNHLAEFWVLCDTVFGNNSSQYIKIYWGKTGAGDSASAANVFKTGTDYNFTGVWHLAASDFTDATSNDNDGTNSGSSEADGIIGKGKSFNATTNYVNVGSGSSVDDLEIVTGSAWIYPTGWGENSYGRILGKGANPTEQMRFRVVNGGGSNGTAALRFDRTRGTTTTDALSANSTLSLSTIWYHVAFVMNGTTSTKLYINGSEPSYYATPTAGSGLVLTDAANNMYIGNNVATDRTFDGILDEVRVENVARSADWIKLCYETQKSGSTVVSEDKIDLLKLRMRNNIGTGTSDTCKLYTDNWAVIFDEDDGAGVKWLSDESSYREDRGTNQLNTNLFYIRASNTNSYALTGQLSLLSYIDSLSCVLRQKVTINSQPWVVDYTVYGSGRMFVNASTEAPLATYDPAGGIEFRVESNATKKAYYSQTATASTSNYILHSDTADGRFDILMAPLEDWSQASGFCATTGNYYGYVDDDWQLNSGNRQSWPFLIDFAHKRWNDTAGVGSHVDDFRTPDSLSFIMGTLRYEKAWEEKLIGHWRLDDGTSGSADAGTATDFSGCGHTGTIKGCTWTTGKLNSGLSLSGGTDSVKITNATDFDNAWEFTVCAWIKKTGTTESNTMIFGKASRQTNKDFKLCCNTDKLVLYLFNISVTGNTSLGTGWRHVAATYNKHTGTVLLYVDGKPDALYMGIPTLAFGTGVVSIGNSFTGVLDDVRFYSKALPEDAIRGIYKNGFVPDRGVYMLRSDNNNTVHFYIDGTSAVPRRFPIFQIANYWSSAKPGFVYRDGVALTEYTDYITGVDNTYHVLTLGLKNSVTAASTRIYIDDNDASGALMVGPMKTLTYGAEGNDYYVKNTSSTSFGAAGSNEFYFYWKMTNSSPASTAAKDGELYMFKSSEESGSAGQAIADCDNMLPDYDTTGGFAYHDHYSSSYARSTSMSSANPPTYTVLEASPTRVRLRIDGRTIDGSSLDYTLTSVWTIYPTGQIFKYDTVTNIVNASNKIDQEIIRWRTKYEASLSSYVNNDGAYRGGVYGGTTVADFAVALIGSGDNTGSKQLITGNSDTVQYQSKSTTDNYSGIRFTGTDDRLNTNQPYRYAWYMDIRHWNMNDAYIDSVCEAVKHINFTDGDMITGSRRNATHGDINGDGFNESEGAYMLTASNNSVNFILEAQAGTDDCRFYPVFNIGTYTSSSKPKYVNLHTSSDTVTMLEGYGYNCYLNDASDYLVIQLDTVLCVDTKIYISADNDLAVTLSEFLAKPGDGNDTVCWRTESEHENLGFNLFRRVNREFLDSVQKIIDTATVDSLVPEEARLFRNKTIDYADTQWVRVNQDMIPGAEGGTSADPRDYEWLDRNVYNGVLYEYKLEMVSFSHEREEKGPIQVKPMLILPRDFMLFHNYPNPMRIYTNIRFDLPVKTKVALYVYNLQGRLITQIIRPNKIYKPGCYMIRWNGTDERGRQLASGPYVYRLVAGNYAKARLMIIIR